MLITTKAGRDCRSRRPGRTAGSGREPPFETDTSVRFSPLAFLLTGRHGRGFPVAITTQRKLELTLRTIPGFRQAQPAFGPPFAESSTSPSFRHFRQTQPGLHRGNSAKRNATPLPSRQLRRS